MSVAIKSPFDIDLGTTQRGLATPVDRLIHLRTMPGLANLSTQGLTYLAQQSVEHFFPEGARVYSPDQPVESVHFVVEGKIRVWQEGRHLLDCNAPGGVGFQPVLSKSTIGQSAIAQVDTITIEISRADVFELLEDDFEFLLSGIRQLSRQMLEQQRTLEIAGKLERSEPELVAYPTEALDLVECLALIGRGPFAEVNLEALVHLVRLTEEIRVEAGEVLWREGEESEWGLHVIFGVISCQADDREFRMGPNSVVGLIEAHGGLPRSYTAVAETKLVALRTTTTSFFDALEDSFSLAIGYLSFLSALVLQLSVRVAKLREGHDPDQS